MAESWTVLALLKWTAEFFRNKGIDNGRLDAELLLAETLHLDRVGLYLNYDRPLQADELAAFRKLIERRARREPLAYILGRCEFWSLPFRVGPEVLIPRPETELLVEEALKRLPQGGKFLDIGVGSGAISVAIAHQRPDVLGEGIDLSVAALALARENAERNGVAERLAYRTGDLFALDGGPYDLIVSNPPYIAATELPGLMPEVRDYEPQLALIATGNGLDCYGALAPAAVLRLHPGGWLLVEVGAGQAPAVRELFAVAGLNELFIARDLSGIERVVGGRKS